MRRILCCGAALLWCACANLSGLTGGDGGNSVEAGKPKRSDASVDARGIGKMDARNDDARKDARIDGARGDATLDAGMDASACNPCVLAKGLNHPFAVTSDATRVYWAEYGDALGVSNGSVKSCPLAGCGAGPLVYASGLTNPRFVVVDAANVYFASVAYESSSGSILSCPLTGCKGTPMVVASATSPAGLALDNTNIYWVDDASSAVSRVLKGGGPVQSLDDRSGAMIEGALACAVDENFLYTNDTNENVFRVPVDGGGAVQMAVGARGGNSPLTLDLMNVYYAANGQVVRALKSATDGGAFVVSGLSFPSGLFVDLVTNTLYWSDYGSGTGNDGKIGQIGTDGSSPMVLLASLTTPQGITVSGGSVFWISNGTLDPSSMSGQTLPSTGLLLERAN